METQRNEKTSSSLLFDLHKECVVSKEQGNIPVSNESLQ